MLYINQNTPKEIIVTANEYSTVFTGTSSVSNAGQFSYAGQFPLLTFTGYVGSTYTFNSTNIALEDNGEFVQETAYNKLTELVPGSPVQGVVLEAKAPTPPGSPDTLWIAISGLNGLWPQYVVVEEGGPEPTIVTNVLPNNYTWLITSADTLQSYTFSAIDNSSSYYYNSFTLSVIPGATYGLTAGVIPTYTTGQHRYNIYQMENYGDLNINNAVRLVETGLLYINGATLSINEYTGGNTVIPTYRG